jgi:hypothetical protein
LFQASPEPIQIEHMFRKSILEGLIEFKNIPLMESHNQKFFEISEKISEVKKLKI